MNHRCCICKKGGLDLIQGLVIFPKNEATPSFNMFTFNSLICNEIFRAKMFKVAKLE